MRIEQSRRVQQARAITACICNSISKVKSHFNYDGKNFISIPDIAANCDEYADATPSTNFSVRLNINFPMQLDHSKQYSQQYHQYDDA